MPDELQELKQRFVEAAGNFSQSFGAGRIIGQIFAHLYFCREPQTLADLMHHLGISKGSASMAVRQLEQWGAVSRIWIKGDRKDFYRANDEFGKIFRKALLDAIAQKIETSDALMNEMESAVASHRHSGAKKDPDWTFFERRLKRFKQFRDRAQWLWEKMIVNVLLK
ncbi:MAG TPA: hypothetical protein PKM67_04760 [Kiritimatiellia bacterium]|nr:hypothetical protein [Kiritimatiellia bacterium]HNS80748.1 hypothetical protein [Kiritimatiellia bacterium]HPA79052.1 hypothetical protein [Kiritimatiellia bacterium]HQQ05183.1 hypothetical protein [Kiritimatiellia bacterium]